MIFFALLFMIFFGALGIGAFILWIWSLIDCLINSRISDSQKILYILLMIFLPIIGNIIYLVVGRKPRTYTEMPPYPSYTHQYPIPPRQFNSPYYQPQEQRYPSHESMDGMYYAQPETRREYERPPLQQQQGYSGNRSAYPHDASYYPEDTGEYPGNHYR